MTETSSSAPASRAGENIARLYIFWTGLLVSRRAMATEPTGGTRSAADIKRALRPAMMLLALVFVGYAAWKLKESWRPTELRVRPIPLVLAVVPLVAAALLQGVAWRLLLENMT